MNEYIKSDLFRYSGNVVSFGNSNLHITELSDIRYSFDGAMKTALRGRLQEDSTISTDS